MEIPTKNSGSGSYLDDGHEGQDSWPPTGSQESGSHVAPRRASPPEPTSRRLDDRRGVSGNRRQGAFRPVRSQSAAAVTGRRDIERRRALAPAASSAHPARPAVAEARRPARHAGLPARTAPPAASAD